MTQIDPLSSPGFFVTVWRQKWVIVCTTAATLAATVVWAHYFLPDRYRAEASVMIVPPRVPLDGAPDVGSVPQRLQTISRQVFSRTRLERIIDEFKLYEADLASRRIEEVIDQMRRRDITLTLTSGEPDGIDGFKVSYASDDPRAAMRVTERLAALIVQENLQDTEIIVDSNLQFIKAQIEDLRREVTESELAIKSRGQKGDQVAQVDLIEYEVRKDTLRALLVKQHELAFAVNRARRQIGEQFRIIDGARLPTRPVSPDRLAVHTAGGVVGVMIGFILAATTSRHKLKRL